LAVLSPAEALKIVKQPAITAPGHRYNFSPLDRNSKKKKKERKIQKSGDV
jgi:hypothetical protein